MRSSRRAVRIGTAIVIGATTLLGCAGGGTDVADGAGTSLPEGRAASGGEQPAADEPAETASGEQDGTADGAAEGTELPDPDAFAEGDLETTASRELPAAFPPEVVLPAEHVINIATESVTDGSRSFVLQLRTSGDPASVFEQLTTRFVEGGWEELQQGTSNFGGAFTSSATYSNGTILVNLGVIDGEVAGTSAVSYSVVPAGPAAEAG